MSASSAILSARPHFTTRPGFSLDQFWTEPTHRNHVMGQNPAKVYAAAAEFAAQVENLLDGGKSFGAAAAELCSAGEPLLMQAAFYVLEDYWAQASGLRSWLRRPV
jgi:hypothetical protein